MTAARLYLLPALALAVTLTAISCEFPPKAPAFSVEQRAAPQATRTAETRPAKPTVPPEPTRPSPTMEAQPTPAPAAVPRLAPPPGTLFSVVNVAAKVRPAVAQILVRGSSLSLFEPVPTAGEGSGVVFDRRGYILTNNHVVQDATEIIVSLPDREKTYTSRLVGRDPATDLAVVQIEPDNLPLANLGDSDALQVGEPVVAIGNALGLEGGPTVTAGVVSALSRSIDEPSGATLYGLIQTDAAINPGNSGGPLINMAGDVIGINTAVATGSSEAPAQGIGFAISINGAKPIINDLMAYGKVRRPYLGVETGTVTPALARQYRLSVDHGAYVARVVKGGPAARAGMEPADVIVKIDDDAIRSSVDLRKVMDRAKIGQKVKIEIVRRGAHRTVEITLAEMPGP